MCHETKIKIFLLDVEGCSYIWKTWKCFKREKTHCIINDNNEDIIF